MMAELRSSVNDLARACSRSADAAEWGQFVRRCTPLASLVALRVSRLWLSAPSPTAVDDIVQEVFLKLCEQERRILADFEPRGEDSFLGLLSMVSASVANDYFRRIYSAKRGGKVVIDPLEDDEVQTSAASARPAAQMQRSALLAQLDDKLRSAPEIVGERDRAFFWLCYRQGFTAEEIAGLPGAELTAKGVESALRRIALWLRGEVEPRKVEDTAQSA
jgi:RNA polymerase sigma-70 factor (ECF subfamily)